MLSNRRCPSQGHEALKKRAKANHRSLNGEPLTWLERESDQEQPVSCAVLAERLREFRKLLTEEEHKALGRAIERGIKLMRREHLH